MKENIKTNQEMEKGKNMIKMVIYNMKENIQMDIELFGNEKFL